MKFLDLFAGIGGFRLGIEMAGHECVGYVEIDKFARKSYQAMHDTEGEWTASDITRVTDDDVRELGDRGYIDIICGGFPCQAFSVAGKRGGFKDTRGTLFFEIARFARILRPRYLFLENVTGLLNHDNGNTFETILRTLDEIGYDAEWDCLNSKNFGVPQNRDRVFIVGHLRGSSTRKVFPVTGENGPSIEQLGNIDQHKRESNNPQTGRVYPTGGAAPCLSTMQGGGLEPKILDDQGRTKKKNKLADIAPTLRRETHGNDPKVVLPVLTPDREEKRQNGRRFKENGEPMFTLTSQDRHGVMVVGNVKPSRNGMNGNVFDSEGLSPTLTTNKGEGPKIFQRGRGYNQGGIHDIAPTLTSSRFEQNNHVIEKPKHIPGPEDVNNTLRTGGKGSLTPKHNYEHIHDGYRIRKLTPRECFRLQGFPDWSFDKAKEVNSDSQLYKQAGNSVTVNVIHEIAKRLVVM